MKLGQLQKLRGIYPPVVPPRDAEETGKKTPNGDVIFRRTVKPRKKVRKLNADGKPLFRGGNPSDPEGTGTPVYEWVPDGPPRDEFFFISRGRHGNNRKIVIDPDALDAEQEMKATRTRKEKLLERVAQLASDTKMDIDEAAKRILGIAAPPSPEPEPEFVTGVTVVDGEDGDEAVPDYEAARDAADSEGRV